MSHHLQFEQLVRDHQDLVFRTLLRLTGSREHLDDLAQEVFLRLFRALPGFRGDALITTYLYRIAVNVAQDEWKRRARERRDHVSLSAPTTSSDDASTWESRLPHPDRDPAQQLEDREFAKVVDHHLDLLTPAERAILVLYHQEERSYEQIAIALQMPVNTVRTHLHRGRKKLRASLDQWRTQQGTPQCTTTH